DHASFTGAEEGVAANPSLAGEGTSIFQAIEAFYNGEHVNILGAGRRFHGILTPDLRDVDTAALRLASMIPNSEPVLIETVPGNLLHLLPSNGRGTAGVRAIEIVDGSPRALSQARHERARTVALSDSLD